MSTLDPSSRAADEAELSLEQARSALCAALKPIAESEVVPLSRALGRILSGDVVAPIDVPAQDNSAMDGYAFAGRDLSATEAIELECVATVLAGAPPPQPLRSGQCVRIMTGAVLGDELDTVVPQELCRVSARRILIDPGAVRAGDNRRRRGEDLAAGQSALQAGRWLKPADLGLMASLGIESVAVKRRLRVALFSTGNELRSLGEALAPGCIYDSNRYSLMAALQRLGLEVIDLGRVRDDPQALQAVLDEALAAHADVVLTSGGVGAGDADHTREVLSRRGEVTFWKVAMRPGRPFAFGPLRGTDPCRTAWLLALPGNPVAALVSFYALAREALLRLAGAHVEPLPVLQARCASAVRKRPGRTELQRARVSPSPTGGWQVEIAASQGSGILRSMSEANALVVLGPERGSIAAGEWVDVWLFDGLT